MSSTSLVEEISRCGEPQRLKCYLEFLTLVYQNCRTCKGQGKQEQDGHQDKGIASVRDNGGLLNCAGNRNLQLAGNRSDCVATVGICLQFLAIDCYLEVLALHIAFLQLDGEGIALAVNNLIKTFDSCAGFGFLLDLMSQRGNHQIFRLHLSLAFCVAEQLVTQLADPVSLSTDLISSRINLGNGLQFVTLRAGICNSISLIAVVTLCGLGAILGTGCVAVRHVVGEAVTVLGAVICYGNFTLCGLAALGSGHGDLCSTISNCSKLTIGNSFLTSYLLETQLDVSTQQEYLTKLSNLREILRVYTMNNPHIHFTIFDSDQISPVISTNASIIGGYDFTTDPIFAAFQKSDSDLLIIHSNSQSYLHAHSESGVYTLAYRLRSFMTRVPIGYLLLDINKEYLQQLFFSHEQLNLTGMMLIDEVGTVLEIVGSTGKETFDTSDLPDPKESYSIVEDRYILFQNDSAFTGWTLLTIADYGSIKSSVASPTVGFIILLSIVPFLLAGISLFLSRYISKPIMTLLKSIRSVEAGDLNTVTPVYRYDELGLLAESFNSMVLKTRQLIEKNNEEALLRQQAQIRELQNQVNPHFIYNTLEMISSMSTSENASQIRSICSHLGSMMRYNLRPERIVKLRDEISQVKDYLSIMQKRFRGLFSYEIIVSEEDVLDCQLGKFTLQPLVENSIKHGLRGISHSGMICITVGKQESCMYCIVHDNGVGIPEDKLSLLTASLDAIDSTTDELLPAQYHGVLSVYTRLLMLFGDRLEFRVESQENAGTTTTILISLDESN